MKKREQEEEELEIGLVRYEIQLLGTLISGYNARRFLKSILCFPKVKKEIDSLPAGGWERFQPLAVLIDKYSQSPHLKIPFESLKENLNNFFHMHLQQKEISCISLNTQIDLTKDAENISQGKATLNLSESPDSKEMLQSRLEIIYGMNRHFSCLRLPYHDFIEKLDREILELQQSQIIQAACDRFIKLQIRYRTCSGKKPPARSRKANKILPSQSVIDEIEPILNDYKSSMYYPRISENLEDEE